MKHLSAVAALFLSSAVFAQEMPATTSLEPWTVNVRHVQADDLLVTLQGRRQDDMHKARKAALDEVVDIMRARLQADPEEDVLRKVMILDEEFDAASRSYEASLRVLTRERDPSFEGQQARLSKFSSPLPDGVSPPTWTLIVPMSVDDEGAWNLVKRNHEWAMEWRIPFRDGVTQFIPATIDADDLAALENSSGFEDLAFYISERYRAPSISFIGRNRAGEMAVIRWQQGDGQILVEQIARPKEEGTLDLRKGLLDAFWKTFETGPDIQFPQ